MLEYHAHAAAIAKKYIGTTDELKPLGWGIDGIVYPSPNEITAVKIHRLREKYNREVAAYQRLLEHGVNSVQGCAVPQLVSFSDEHMLIEMSVVKVPFLLDFAAATLDDEGDFDMDEWWERKRAEFDGDDFDKAQSIWGELAHKYGIYYWDLKPGNLTLRR